MKLSLPLFIALLLACVGAACHRAKVAAPPAPAPNAVGQWQWSNDLLGTWQLDLKADGTFERVTTTPGNPLDLKPVINSGTWTLSINPPPSGLIRPNDVSDDMLRAANVGENDQTIQWSAPATMAFFYTVPKNSELPPGASWNGVTHAQSDTPGSPVMAEVVEQHDLRTHTDTKTGEVFLDLGGKVLKTRSGKIATEIPAAAPAATGEVDYITISPYSGIRLEVPATWQAVNPAGPEAPPIPVTSLTTPPQPSPPNGWLFHPPGAPGEAFIVVAIQASTMSPQQMAEASEINLERFAWGFAKSAARPLDGRSFYLAPDVKAERTTIGLQSAVLCTTSLSDPEGNRRALRAYAIPKESATVAFICCWNSAPGNPWKPIMERAGTSLRIVGK